MASIEDLCWTLVEDLFGNVDLDSLYVRQLRCLGSETCQRYPYRVLVHTGKITIALDLSRGVGCSGWTFEADTSQDVDTRPRTTLPHIEDPSE